MSYETKDYHVGYVFHDNIPLITSKMTCDRVGVRISSVYQALKAGKGIQTLYDRDSHKQLWKVWTLLRRTKPHSEEAKNLRIDTMNAVKNELEWIELGAAPIYCKAPWLFYCNIDWNNGRIVETTAEEQKQRLQECIRLFLCNSSLSYCLDSLRRKNSFFAINEFDLIDSISRQHDPNIEILVEEEGLSLCFEYLEMVTVSKLLEKDGEFRDRLFDEYNARRSKGEELEFEEYKKVFARKYIGKPSKLTIRARYDERPTYRQQLGEETQKSETMTDEARRILGGIVNVENLTDESWRKEVAKITEHLTNINPYQWDAKNGEPGLKDIFFWIQDLCTHKVNE